MMFNPSLLNSLINDLTGYKYKSKESEMATVLTTKIKLNMTREQAVAKIKTIFYEPRHLIDGLEALGIVEFEEVKTIEDKIYEFQMKTLGGQSSVSYRDIEIGLAKAGLKIVEK